MQNLEKLGYKKHYNEDGMYYEKSFPVVKSKSLLGVITITDIVKIDCIDAVTRVPYAPFYYYEFGNYKPLLDKINKRINKELARLKK